MNRVAAGAAGLLLLAAAALVVARSAPASQVQEGWRTFEGAWSAIGTRQTLPTETARPAAIVRLSGAVALSAGGLGRGFHGELIGFDDGSAPASGRWAWTDDRGDRVYGLIAGDPLQSGRKWHGTITGGSGRYAGMTGEFDCTWQYVVFADDGSVQGRATSLVGRYRIGGGRP